MHELRKILDEIAYELRIAVRDSKKAWQSVRKGDNGRQQPRPFRREGVPGLSTRISDMAIDWSCDMRNALGHFLKAAAILCAIAALFPFVIGVFRRSFHPEALLFIGLALAAAYVFRLVGRKAHESADRKRYAQYQHRLLRLAREKGGYLTVVEAATDGRMTVEKAAEILDALAVGGSAELRVSESGLVVYHFPEIERGSEIFRAKPVDDL
ncbi:MAG: hypothetical protein OXU79_14830 [Gemmatimonadota bacterium]|nr:hypothetical protein [Gemmatimonadota bacterium]